MADWNINKPTRVCAGTGEDIQPGQDYIATIVHGEEGLERKDYFCQYWDENQPQVYCYWKSKMPAEDEKKKLFVDNDMLMAFFDRLTDETAEDKINFRFVLTLILMRKRLLKYDSSKTEDDKEIWTLKVTGQNRNVNVVNPHLNEDKIEELSSQLGQVLQVEFDEE